MTVDDPFATLSLPRTFRLDPSEVQSAYLRAASRAHPDRFQDPQDRVEAEVRTAKLNEAKNILLDDEARADSLLRLLGGPAKEADRSLPHGFLLEMMEIRQRLEEDLASDDAAARTRWKAWAAQQRSGRVERVGSLFEQAKTGASAGALAAIRLELNAWRYIERVIEQLDSVGHPPD